MAIEASSFTGYTPITDRVFIVMRMALPKRQQQQRTLPRAIPIGAHPNGDLAGLRGGVPVAKAAHGLDAPDATFPAGGSKAEHDDRAILHVMSNTGWISAAATLNAYRQRHGTSACLPHRLCVNDSAPGSVVFTTQVGRWARAMALGTARQFPWPFAVTKGLWYMFLYAVHLLGAALRREPAGVYSQRAFLDHAMATPRAPRLYIYSKDDDLIGWKDLENQAATARNEGYTTILERFEGSPHTGHMPVDPDRYWGAIARCWKESSTERKLNNIDKVKL
ncbi:DUF829-domain-containing protein [Biscogniauxia marginata]|nr:DUF829-domain-containing protein [Biscogniauxia marginata]